MNNRTFAGAVLPPASLTPCGRLTATPEQFYWSGREEARRLVEELGVSAASSILDIGCGAGRLAIGLIAEEVQFSSYLGIDVARSRIEWCQNNIQNINAKFHFKLIDMANDRYNPSGKMKEPALKFDNCFSVIYLYSVFSHMLEFDVRAYLELIERQLTTTGRCFATAFTATNVPNVTENPKGFGPLNWKGPLHCVLYNEDFWSSLLQDYNLRIMKRIPNINVDGQTGFIISRI